MDDFKLEKIYTIPKFGTSGCFSLDNKYAYSYQYNARTIQKLEISTGRVAILHKFPITTYIASDLYYHHTGNLFFVVGENITKGMIFKILTCQTSSGKINVHDNMQFESDDTYANFAFLNNCLLVHFYGELIIIDLDTGTVIFNKVFPAHSRLQTKSIGFSNNYVAVPLGRMVKIFDIANSKKIFTLNIARVKNITFSANEKYLVCTAVNNEIRQNVLYILNFHTGAVIRKINLGSIFDYGLVFSPSGENVFINTDGDDFLFYNIPTSQILSFEKDIDTGGRITGKSIVSNDLNYLLSSSETSSTLWKVV